MLGLRPTEFWALSWPDYDDLVYYHYYQQQQQLAGARMVATHLHNLGQGFAKHPRFQSPREHWPLPLLDGPAPADNAPPAEWWARMEALAAASGKQFIGATA